jgi:probable phosphoglycerate mutase
MRAFPRAQSSKTASGQEKVAACESSSTTKKDYSLQTNMSSKRRVTERSTQMPRQRSPVACNNLGKMQRIVYLVRHGETDWNRDGRWQGCTDIPLNATGETQALALAERLRAHRIARIVSSDLSRAHRTAEIVATALGVDELVLDAELRERGFGLFEGLTREECESRYPAEWKIYRAEAGLPPGAERHDLVAERMVRAVTRAALATPLESGVLVVTHGSALRAFVRAATGAMPAPLSNCALFRAIAVGERFVAVERID